MIRKYPCFEQNPLTGAPQIQLIFAGKLSSGQDSGNRNSGNSIRIVLDSFLRFFSVYCENTFCDTIFCETVFCGSVFCGTVFCGSVFCETVFCGTVFCGTAFGKTSPHGLGDVFRYFIAVLTNGRADCRVDIFRSASINLLHFPDRDFTDPCSSSLPAAVRQCNDPSDRIIAIDRNTVRVGGIENQSGHIRYEPVDICIIAVSGDTLPCVSLCHYPYIGSVCLLCAYDPVRRGFKKQRDAPEIFIYISPSFVL